MPRPRRTLGVGLVGAEAEHVALERAHDRSRAGQIEVADEVGATAHDGDRQARRPCP